MSCGCISCSACEMYRRASDQAVQSRVYIYIYIFNNKETTNFAKQNAGCRIKFENKKSRMVLLGAAPVVYTGL